MGEVNGRIFDPNSAHIGKPRPNKYRDPYMPCGKKRVCDDDGVYEWWYVPWYSFFSPPWKFLPWDEYVHNPLQVDDTAWKLTIMDKAIPGTELKVQDDKLTPDFRIPEPVRLPKYETYYNEKNRFYRISPSYQYLLKWSYYQKSKPGENTQDLACYVVCVYKRLTPLSMGAVLTSRHILTTAMATDMILKKFQKKKVKSLYGILGFWYEVWDYWAKLFRKNSSMYLYPVRIHYHPAWNPPEKCNRSHPIPSVYDVSVWTMGQTLWNGDWNVFYCKRWTNPPVGILSPPVFPSGTIAIMVGVQWIRDIGRVPFPWFKYMMRMSSGLRQPCPKTEWGWFMCIEMHHSLGRLGADVGSPLHIIPDNGAYVGWWDRTFKKAPKPKRGSGLAGINSFAMRLRSVHFVNYFTQLDRHTVLDFFYDAYFGRIPASWLDARFKDTKGSGSPKAHTQPVYHNYYRPKNYKWGKYYKPIWW